MSKQHLFLWAALAAALLSVAAVGDDAVSQAESTAGPEAARLSRFTATDGTSYFALSVTPSVVPKSREPHDLVVMVDTSASQIGEFRTVAFAALDAVLADLPEQDRVQLVAVDLDATPLTPGFVSPRGPEMREARAKLSRRVPLGSTDMAAALRTTANLFNDPARQRAAIYIGDGASRANADYQAIRVGMNQLVERRVPLSSFGVGPDVDMALLAALANHTGGGLAADSRDAVGDAATTNARLAGVALADGAHVPVFYPTAAPQVSAELGELYPQNFLPLRGDRDTVVLGTGKVDRPFQLELQTEVNGRPETLSWQVMPTQSQQENAYLAKLVSMARDDNGTLMPTVGTQGLEEARRMVKLGAHQLTKLGGQAAMLGDRDAAQKLARQAQALDPTNPNARLLNSALQKQAADGADAPLRMVNLQGDAVAPPPVAPGSLLERSDLLSEIESTQRVIEGALQTEVTNAISEATRILPQDPTAAIDVMKLTLERVAQAQDIDPGLRAQLRSNLENTIRRFEARRVEIEARRQEREEALASAENRRLILKDLQFREQKIAQLMAKFNSLMDEGRYLDAHALAQLASQEDPDNVALDLAEENSRFVNNFETHMGIRELRHRAAFDVYASVEASSIPFPDDQPILYPDPDEWIELTERRKEFASVDLAPKGPAEERILRELDGQTDLEFLETPLQDVLEYIEDVEEIPIEIDRRALDDVGIGTDTPITRNLKGITLRSALRLLLSDLDLTYVIEDEVLLITTPEVAETKLVTRVYPVADLVLPVQALPFAGGFGGLGGFGGMGGGGGMGGMGMGGMGGGGGGLGGGGGGLGGGGGGGFFSVPAAGVRQPAADGFRAFDVKAAAEKASEKKEVAAKNDASQHGAADDAAEKEIKLRKSPKGAGPIDIDLNTDADPLVLWNDHFSKGKEDPARVRETVRQLMNRQQYDHVIALLQGALRNGQPQVWMYEAMTLAMEAAGSPRTDIERALMSTADFVQSPEELLYIAAYMSHKGFDARAVKLFRHVSRFAPQRPEPYVLGLKAAERAGDLEGVRWATVEILSRPWPKDKAAIWDKAYHLASSTLETLRKEKKAAEAEAYKQELDQAMRRDLVAVVRWHGDADIDLYVEEPSGTVCSHRNPYTTSGGVMLEDSYAGFGEATDEGLAEAYSVPEGFDGKYRFLIRRVWGDVTAGRVTIDVVRHYGTSQAKQSSMTVEIGEKDAVVNVDLEGGRRQEQLAEHEVANAAVRQINVRHQILAQQINGLADPSAAERFAAGRLRPFVVGQHPFGGRGAVGFQPVLAVLPEGTNFMAQAVISADRRYVRVTALPLFSSIPEVNVFNMLTGENGEGQGGGQGGFSGNPFGGGGGGGGSGGGGLGGGLGGGAGGAGGGLF